MVKRYVCRLEYTKSHEGNLSIGEIVSHGANAVMREYPTKDFGGGHNETRYVLASAYDALSAHKASPACGFCRGVGEVGTPGKRCRLCDGTGKCPPAASPVTPELREAAKAPIAQLRAIAQLHDYKACDQAADLLERFAGGCP